MGNCCRPQHKKHNNTTYNAIDTTYSDLDSDSDSGSVITSNANDKIMEIISHKLDQGFIELNIALVSSSAIDHKSLYTSLKPIEDAGGHLIISKNLIIRGEEYLNIYSDVVPGHTTYTTPTYTYLKIKPHAREEPIIPYQYSSDIIYQTVPKYYREQVCIICYERLANVLYKACGHLQVCYPCHTNKKDPNYIPTSEGRAICPTCFARTGKRGTDWIPLTRKDLLKYPITLV